MDSQNHGLTMVIATTRGEIQILSWFCVFDLLTVWLVIVKIFAYFGIPWIYLTIKKNHAIWRWLGQKPNLPPAIQIRPQFVQLAKSILFKTSLDFKRRWKYKS